MVVALFQESLIGHLTSYKIRKNPLSKHTPGEIWHGKPSFFPSDVGDSWGFLKMFPSSKSLQFLQTMVETCQGVIQEGGISLCCPSISWILSDDYPPVTWQGKIANLQTISPQKPPFIGDGPLSRFISFCYQRVYTMFGVMWVLTIPISQVRVQFIQNLKSD